MIIISRETLISGIFNYLFIIIFCLIGAIVKDTYNTMVEKDTKVNIARILISTLFSSILLFSISDYIVTRITWKLFILPCFFGGMIGFELLGKMHRLSFWLKFYNDRKKAINKIIKEESEKDNE